MRELHAENVFHIILGYAMVIFVISGLSYSYGVNKFICNTVIPIIGVLLPIFIVIFRFLFIIIKNTIVEIKNDENKLQENSEYDPIKFSNRLIGLE